ncbi:unnamed protein product [Prunus armeniaca]
MDGRCGGRGGLQPQNRQNPPVRERYLRDIEVDDLRRQVQQLQHRLERYEPREHDDPHYESENEASDGEEEYNPFGREHDRDSSIENNHRHHGRNNYFQQNFGIKVDVPEFEGKM